MCILEAVNLAVHASPYGLADCMPARIVGHFTCVLTGRGYCLLFLLMARANLEGSLAWASCILKGKATAFCICPWDKQIWQAVVLGRYAVCSGLALSHSLTDSRRDQAQSAVMVALKKFAEGKIMNTAPASGQQSDALRTMRIG